MGNDALLSEQAARQRINKRGNRRGRLKGLYVCQHEYEEEKRIELRCIKCYNAEEVKQIQVDKMISGIGSNDAFYECDGRKYVWNRDKYEYNVREHNVTFEEAATIFSADSTLEYTDEVHSEDEERFIAIGFSLKSNLLFVCFCEREEGDLTRIISARKADRPERERFIAELHGKDKGR